jgi:hypothetical protein
MIRWAISYPVRSFTNQTEHVGAYRAQGEFIYVTLQSRKRRVFFVENGSRENGGGGSP